MSDKLRIALKGSGKVRVSIQQGNNKDFFLEAIEDWARLTSVQRAVIKAEELAATADPDALIWEVLQKLVQECHINREARKQIAALVPTPNDPLTRDQLLEMDGEPLWIFTRYDENKSFWAIVNTACEDVESYARVELFDDYGADWLAYRRKPENRP